MATTMVVKPAGSWSQVTGTAGQVTTTLALPGSWKWFPPLTVLVRNDQVANLPP